MPADSAVTVAPTPLTRAMDTVRKLKAQLREKDSATPLAVVGVGLRLAAGIDDLDSYWQALAEGRDLVHPLPGSRMGPFAAEWEPLPHTGGFLDEVMDFDADFFDLRAEEASGLDPQHRLLLEVVWESLENAALPPDRLEAARTGLFIGITGQEYWDWRTEPADVSWATGNGHCFAVGRIAYAMGLAGPAIAVDTACSSSLISVHLARQALLRRECDVALAGGVNLVLSPHATRLHNLAGNLSPDGQCRAFDARANGFTRGEGCGIVVLKRLDDARRDGDRIHAVIHGSAVNQSGRSTGFGAPNVLSQITLIETALADAGLSPSDIGLVEAHGTGTSLGDAIEIEAIAAALGRRNGGAPLPVGSVKTNMGHLESAAGIVGLIKNILCLQHRAVPPLVHFSRPNPLIDLDGTGISLPAALEPWRQESGRYAGISAFGAGGTNAHVILGANQEKEPGQAVADAGPVGGFELSAKSPEVLRTLAGRFCERLGELPDESYPAFAYTATSGRARHTWRAEITAPDRGAALRALRSLSAGEPSAETRLYQQDQWLDEDGSGVDLLPRAVVDLPSYPWTRARYAPRPADPVVAPAAPSPEPDVCPDNPLQPEPVDDSLFELTWEQVSGGVVRPGSGTDTAAAGWWLVLADGAGLGRALCEQLAARSGTCVSVTAGERFRRLDAAAYELDPLRSEDFAALFDDLRTTRDEPFAGVVHAWALDAPSVDDPDDLLPGSPWQAQEAGAVSALHLIQLLAGSQPGKAPRLVLLTRGTQLVTDDEAVGPTSASPAQAPPCSALLVSPPPLSAPPFGASLWGLAAVAAVEHPELRLRLLDLDPAAPEGEAARVLDELLTAEVNLRTAIRGLARYLPVLVRRRPAIHPDLTWRRRPFDLTRDESHRILAEQPGILASLTPTPWKRTPPGPGQVEIEVAAAGLNFSDLLKAMGAYPGASGTVPLGVECAGRVSALGEGVDHLCIGDPVMAIASSAMAAYVTTESHLVSPRPGGLTDEQSAGTPIAFLTAVYGLSHLARLGAGDTVLIHSATGGVGLASLMVARQAGAEIFATAGTEAKRTLLRSLGVRHVMDSRSLAFAEEISGLTGGRGVDVVLNSLTGEAMMRSLSLLAPGGRFVEIGKRDIYDDTPMGLGLLKKNRSVFAVDMEQVLWERPTLVCELFAEVLRGFEAGHLTALPVSSYPYAEAGEAFSFLARGKHTGKLVLRRGDVREVAVPPVPLVRADATYLITGGLGAPGLETATRLAALGAGHLVLVDHDDPSGNPSDNPSDKGETESVLEELRSRQVEVLVLDTDLQRYDDVVAMLTRLRRSMPPLAGIVCADGTLDQATLLELDQDRVRQAFGPAVAGAWHLHRATADQQPQLEFFVLYSCAATLLGTPGRATEAMAGAILDALVAHRRGRGLPALVVNHEAILALGELLGTSGAAARVLSLSTGSLGSGEARCADEGPLLGEGPRAPAEGTAPASLAIRLTSAAVQPEAESFSQIRQQLLAVAPGRGRRALLIQHCREVAADLLRADAPHIDPAAPLASLGFDSLRTLELRARLERSLQIRLPATLGWQFPSIQLLATFLAERMEVELDDAPAPSLKPPTGHAEPVATHDELELEQMSETQIEAIILAKIEQLNEGAQR